MDLANIPFEAAKGGFRWAYKNTINVPWVTLSDQAVAYIATHLCSTVIQIASASSAVCPGLVCSPILTWIGFSNLVPVAGEKGVQLASNSNVTDTT